MRRGAPRHQPTPRSVADAEGTAGEGTEAALALLGEARAADLSGQLGALQVRVGPSQARATGAPD